MDRLLFGTQSFGKTGAVTMAASLEPIAYDYSGALIEGTGISEADIAALAAPLEAARREVLDDRQLAASGKPLPPEKVPLDCGFIDWPDNLLKEYEAQRADSQVGRILAAAANLGEHVDRVVVLGIGGSYLGARAVFEACCHPYHNELSRAERGGKPRLYFAGHNVDNDSTLALIDLLHSGHSPATGALERWGIEVISKSGGTLETAIALRQFLAALSRSLGGDDQLLRQLVIPVTGDRGKLSELAQAAGWEVRFPIPDGIGGRYSVLTAVGLLPMATVGVDIIKLLEGAAAMNARFQKALVAENPVLNYVAVAHLMEVRRGATIRVLSAWGQGLEAAGMWYDQLLAESLGKHERGATPLTAVNTRDLHSRGQQHQQGRRDKLITNLVVDRPRRPPLAIGAAKFDQDQLNVLARKTLPEVLGAAMAGTNQAYAEVGRPTTALHLPRLDEASLGQFFQMMMLATAVEGRLIGINPYGQPGVESYKKHMTALLYK